MSTAAIIGYAALAAAAILLIVWLLLGLRARRRRRAGPEPADPSPVPDDERVRVRRPEDEPLSPRGREGETPEAPRLGMPPLRRSEIEGTARAGAAPAEPVGPPRDAPSPEPANPGPADTEPPHLRLEEDSASAIYDDPPSYEDHDAPRADEPSDAPDADLDLEIGSTGATWDAAGGEDDDWEPLDMLDMDDPERRKRAMALGAATFAAGAALAWLLSRGKRRPDADA